MNTNDIVSLIKCLEQNKSSCGNSSSGDGDCVWKCGKKYLIRTVTMCLTGRIIKCTENELLLEDAAWVADTGRFNNALKTGELQEVEPFPGDTIVNRNSVVDATEWNHSLPREVK